MTFPVLAVVLASLLAVPPAAWAAKRAKEPVGARVAGKVVGSDGRTPVRDVVVRVRPLEGDQAFSSKPTGGKGEFVLTGLPYGYADVFLETPQGIFGGSKVIALAPEGKLVVTFRLTRFEERSADFWAGRDRAARDFLGDGAAGLADMEQSVRGVEFWKSPAGIAVIGGITAGVILGIALTSRSSNDSP